MITATPEGRTVCYRPALATGLRSADYEALTEHPSTIYPYGLVKALCLVLVISDNAQVLIMCLRLYVAKDD
jgi:hypothetical protein